MKKLAAITLTSMMLLLATAMVVGAVDKVEVRGAVPEQSAAKPTWLITLSPGIHRTSPASSMT